MAAAAEEETSPPTNIESLLRAAINSQSASLLDVQVGDSHVDEHGRIHDDNDNDAAAAAVAAAAHEHASSIVDLAEPTLAETYMTNVPSDNLQANDTGVVEAAETGDNQGAISLDAAAAAAADMNETGHLAALEVDNHDHDMVLDVPSTDAGLGSEHHAGAIAGKTRQEIDEIKRRIVDRRESRIKSVP